MQPEKGWVRLEVLWGYPVDKGVVHPGGVVSSQRVGRRSGADGRGGRARRSGADPGRSARCRNPGGMRLSRAGRRGRLLKKTSLFMLCCLDFPHGCRNKFTIYDISWLLIVLFFGPVDNIVEKPSRSLRITGQCPKSSAMPKKWAKKKSLSIKDFGAKVRNLRES